MEETPPTIAACLTPPGSGAIATVAVRGPRAWEVIREFFHPPAGKTLPPTPEAGRLWFGRFGPDAGDEVMLAVKQAAPDPWLEIHCHGGTQGVRWLLELVAGRGVAIRSWPEFVRSSDEDALRAEAAIALAEAATVRTAAILLDQHQGAFARAWQTIQDSLAEGAGERLQALARYLPVGKHLTKPWRVVVAGAPNVGKSSLVNALAGFQRSVVAPTPGTTRDVVTTLIAADGWPVELADTAGLRLEAADLEGQGIQRALQAVAAADLCLWVLDGANEPVWPTEGAGPMRLVINKVDLPAAWDFARAPEAIQVSARTGAGISGLCDALGRWLVPAPPPPGAAVPFTEALAQEVETAVRSWSRHSCLP